MYFCCCSHVTKNHSCIYKYVLEKLKRTILGGGWNNKTSTKKFKRMKKIKTLKDTDGTIYLQSVPVNTNP